MTAFHPEQSPREQEAKFAKAKVHLKLRSLSSIPIALGGGCEVIAVEARCASIDRVEANTPD